MEIFRNYSFIIVALGTVILAMATGIIGSISVLKGKSLIGDAIGHSTYPGIVLAFMLSMEKSPLILLLGAAIAGAISFFLIDIIANNSKIDLDATLAIVLSSFFGLGMVLKSFIQGNPIYAGVSQSGLKNYIFGQASYIMKNDVKIIFVVSIFSLLLLLAFYKEIKVYVFDEVYAKTIGINPTLMNTVILLATMLLITTGLKLVGAILISSMLIVPAITALQWTDKFHEMLIIAGFCGGVSAFIGTYISTVYDGMSTGSTIILIMSFISLISMIIGPRGMRTKIVRKKYDGLS
ncbi:Manganese transport system membrane protein mntB [Anaerococcus prevotii]|uniref:ABC-3 protein n=1 Tax=Anaerococcus prevotii (strain ATCC 9321 / DSM 20548 / JCM 6508 / NCTC 11806 / PC1) TaxID=525919 RepID=C7RGX6_ANAPD|nr:iron chelate uptake ABC transporter family permease subunit [Anaerococcus prevotii]ACV28737.1 ABC-3 protein [Anaerococcus prevotii DSM 20548]MDU3137591.1 iron chelate uptake ABC transporter family permease subunit [Anaerococcus prevotii]MDU4671953.1 iron chelate uptake ABC transporter family permease subunit [Finegoldia magna]SUU94409.1 Manganese transport system membrane protein mntB [Anaerococcus prevotii]